jgi:hypothetical protein
LYFGDIKTFDIPAYGQCIFVVPIEPHEFLTNSFDLIEIATSETCACIGNAQIISRILDGYFGLHPKIGPAILVTEGNNEVIQIENFYWRS